MENKEKVEKVEEQTKKYEVKPAPIDEDVLKEAKKNIEKAVTDPKLLNRMTLNCLCETLAEIKHLSQSVDSFLDIISICSNKKIVEFFNGVRKNLKKQAEKVAKSDQKAEDSAKKLQQDTKSGKNVVKFPPKNVK